MYKLTIADNVNLLVGKMVLKKIYCSTKALRYKVESRKYDGSHWCLGGAKK